MMIPSMTPSLTPEHSKNAMPAPARPRVSSLASCLIGVLGLVACTGTIDENEQRSSLLPNGASTSGTNAGASGSTAPAARAPIGATSPSGDGERAGENISGLESDSASDRRSGGSRRRASDRDRDDEDDDDVDAGAEEPVVDAGVLEDAGILDGGVVEVDGGVLADAGTAQ